MEGGETTGRFSTAEVAVPAAARVRRAMQGQTGELPTVPVGRRHEWYRPGPLSVGLVLLTAAAVYGVFLLGVDPHRANTYWYIARGTGFVSYGLLTLSVAIGTLLASRWTAFKWPWLVAERLHPLIMYVSGMFLSFHVVALLLLNYPVSATFIPLVGDFAPVHVAGGILAMYLVMVLILSTYVMGSIGFTMWRRLHYAAYFAWVLATLHGIETGNDAGTSWAWTFYIASAALVIVFVAAYGISRLLTKRLTATSMLG